MEEKIGKNICILREHLGLSIEDVASKSDLEISEISNIENGSLQPSISSLYKISEALGTNINLFLSSSREELIERFDNQMLTYSARKSNFIHQSKVDTINQHQYFYGQANVSDIQNSVLNKENEHLKKQLEFMQGLLEKAMGK